MNEERDSSPRSGKIVNANAPDNGGLPKRPARREPMLNLPGFVTALAGLLIAIHIVRAVLLPENWYEYVLIAFSFLPARYGGEGAGLAPLLAAWWTPITYSLLHAGWLHLVLNLFWLAAFATPLCRRIGGARTLAIAIFASLGGALAHFLAFPLQWVPVIGASAVVSGFMGAAARFVFTGPPGARMNPFGPALSIRDSLFDPRFLICVGVWLALNALAGSGIAPIGGAEARIAWQAHMGGFLAGFLTFGLFDRGDVRGA